MESLLFFAAVMVKSNLVLLPANNLPELFLSEAAEPHGKTVLTHTSVLPPPPYHHSSPIFQHNLLILHPHSTFTSLFTTKPSNSSVSQAR